jgi:hypothetical protein
MQNIAIAGSLGGRTPIGRVKGVKGEGDVGGRDNYD